MSDANRVTLRYVKEVTYGVNPGVALKNLRFLSETLGQTTEMVQSQEIRADRQVADVKRVNIGADGDIAFELTYATFDEIFEALFWGAWSSDINISSALISADTSDDSFNSAGGLFTSIQAGDFIQVGGFVATGNNNTWQVLTKTNNKITVDGNLTTEATGATITIHSSRLIGGNTEVSLLVEKEIVNGAGVSKFVSFDGGRIGNGQLTISPTQLISGQFSFSGRKATPASATVGVGAPIAANTNEVLNAVDNISRVREGGAVSALDITQIQFTIENTLRNRNVIAYLGRKAIRPGTQVITGTMSCYFEDFDVYQKYIDQTVSDLSFLVTDVAGNKIAFYFPQLKFTGGNPTTPGLDQDIMVDFTFQAYLDPTLAYSVAMFKMAA